MPLTPGTLLSLTIEKPAAGGRMIARLDGQIVLVSGAIPGERVAARVERVAKGVVYAAVTTVEERSPDRRDATSGTASGPADAVASDPLCGGCLYRHIAYPRQVEIKGQVIADAFARIARVALPGAVTVAPSREDGYRMRARLHVRGGRIGFLREGTHDLCDARPTRQLRPDTCDALDHLAGVHGAALDAYGEIELSENVVATERSIATGRRILVGDQYVHDALVVDGRELTWRRHVLAFFQGNRYLLGALVSHVATLVPENAQVVDLYAGAGLFSVAAAAKGATVTAVEGDRLAAADLEWNLRRAGAAEAKAFHEPVEAFTRRAGVKPDTLIVDPPRTGMSKEALAGALRLAARQLVYVSCDVATLARDARLLVDAGYTIERMDGFDMFPNTPHVEVVAAFSRRS